MRVGLPEASHVTDKSSKAQRVDKARGAHRYSARAGLTPSLSWLNPPSNPEYGRNHCYSRFTDGETEAQRSAARSPRSPQELAADPVQAV